MNCLIVVKDNLDNKLYIFFFFKSRFDIRLCIMFVWVFVKDYYFYIKIIGCGMLGFGNVRFRRGLIG